MEEGSRQTGRGGCSRGDPGKGALARYRVSSAGFPPTQGAVGWSFILLEDYSWQARGSIVDAGIRTTVLVHARRTPSVRPRAGLEVARGGAGASRAARPRAPGRGPDDLDGRGEERRGACPAAAGMSRGVTSRGAQAEGSGALRPVAGERSGAVSRPPPCGAGSRSRRRRRRRLTSGAGQAGPTEPRSAREAARQVPRAGERAEVRERRQGGEGGREGARASLRRRRLPASGARPDLRASGKAAR